MSWRRGAAGRRLGCRERPEGSAGGAARKGAECERLQELKQLQETRAQVKRGHQPQPLLWHLWSSVECWELLERTLTEIWGFLTEYRPALGMVKKGGPGPVRLGSDCSIFPLGS